MGRWEPDARGRLAKAALELYGERGFEQTTVGEIAQRAGVTERTFFRHYADKREVLFNGAAEMECLFVRAVAGAPVGGTPLDAVAVGLEAMAGAFEERRAFVQKRQAVICAHPDLQERELIKMASLAAALTRTLRERGVGEPGASLAAEAGVAVFKVGFERWIAAGEERGMAEIMREGLAAFKAVTCGGSAEE
jgi:AcrR family transcriptional regulator